MTRVGILTGGGDCPGLNAVIRAIVRRGLEDEETTCVGFRHGWAGVLAGNSFELTRASIIEYAAARRIPTMFWGGVSDAGRLDVL